MNASPAPARRAVSAIFFLNGAVLASWIPHIPEIKASHGLSDGRLGLVLLAMAAGAITAMPIAGAMVARFGSRTMTTIAAIAFALVLPLPILSPSVPLLAAALFILGAWNGTLDVSMNAHAVAVERRYGRPIMSSFHALFSLGGLAGAAIAGLAIASGVGRVTHVLIASGVAVAIIALAVGRLLPTAPETSKDTPTFAWPSRALLGLGSLAFLGLLAEGAMADWSAVYLHDVLRATPGMAATGFAAFSLAMGVGRFSGDSLVLRYGSAVVLCASSTVAALGLGVALAIGAPLVAVLGFGAVGFGIANVIPILFSAAGNVPGVNAGVALAAVATTGYFGFLAGPALIGLVAEATSLRVGLALVSAACAFIALRGRVVSAPPASEVLPVRAAEPAAQRQEVMALAGFLALASLLATGHVLAADSFPTKRVLSLQMATKIADAAQAEAMRRGSTVVIAVVDDGGHLILLHRLDDTQVASVEVGIGKARTAAIFRRPSKEFEDQIRSGRVAALALPGATPLQGGVPLVVAGQVIGAIGVSGNTPQEDEDIAKVGAGALPSVP